MTLPQLLKQYLSGYPPKAYDIESLYKKDKKIVRFVLHDGRIRHHFSSADVADFYVTRARTLSDAFEQALKKHPIPIRDLVFYIYIGDELPQQYEEYPIFTFAKKKNNRGLLVPDWSFFNPYTSKIVKDWDVLKQEIIDACPTKITYDKVFFFRGRNTSGRTEHNIREGLYTTTKNDPRFRIDLDPNNDQPLTSWCSYRFLLDLPGSSPWSVRLKEILLLRSVVVKIDVVSKKDPHNVYIQFYTPLLEAGKDYASLRYVYDDKNGMKNLLKDLDKVYRWSTPRCQIMIQRGRQTIKSLTLDRVYHYMSGLLRGYHDIMMGTPRVPITPLIDPKRPCSSKTRKPERYTRAELQDLCHKHGIPINAKTTIDEMCRLLRERVPIAAKVGPGFCMKLQKILAGPVVNEEDALMREFKSIFHDQLVGWIDHPLPVTKVLLKGGMNYNIIMTERYNRPSPFPTRDYDFMIGTSLPHLTFNEWDHKIRGWVARHKDVLTYKTIRFDPPKHTPYFGYTKYYTITIRNQENDFIDVAICGEDAGIEKKDVDVEISRKTGLPVQTLDSAFHELTRLLYAQSLIKASYAYTLRNPFVGTKREKGIKDLNRFELLCKIREFKPQCDLLKHLHYHFPVTKEYLSTKNKKTYEKWVAVYLI